MRLYLRLALAHSHSQRLHESLAQHSLFTGKLCYGHQDVKYGDLAAEEALVSLAVAIRMQVSRTPSRIKYTVF